MTLPQLGMSLRDEIDEDGNPNMVEIHEEIEDDLGNKTRGRPKEIFEVAPYLTKVEIET